MKELFKIKEENNMSEYWEEIEARILKATPEEMREIVDNMEMEIFSAMGKEAQRKYEDYLNTEDD